MSETFTFLLTHPFQQLLGLLADSPPATVQLLPFPLLLAALKRCALGRFVTLHYRVVELRAQSCITDGLPLR